MYKLLHEENQYLNELKTAVTPERLNEQEIINEYVDYLDFMQEADELFLTELDKAALVAKGNELLKQAGVQRARISKLVSAGQKDAAKAAQATLAKITKHYNTVKQQASAVAGDVAKKASEVGAQASKKASEVGADVAKGARGVAGKISKGAGDLAGKAKELASTPGAKYAAVGVIAAAAALASYKVYKRFFSQAAKACKGKSGSEKTACMNAYKVKGLNASKSELRRGLSKCAKTKDPGKCKAAIQKKVLSIDAKIKGLSG